MKKLRRISLLLAVIMALFMLLTACGNTPDETHETTAEATDATETASTDTARPIITASILILTLSRFVRIRSLTPLR